MATRGESITIKIIVPQEHASGMSDIKLNLGRYLQSDSESLTVVGNVITWKISSEKTRNLVGGLYLIASITFQTFGTKKNIEGDYCLIQFLDSVSEFSNTAKSNIDDLTINFTIDEDGLVASESFMTLYRGKNALELFREDQNLPNATREEMMNYDFANSSLVTDLQNGKLNFQVSPTYAEIGSRTDKRIIEVVSDVNNNNGTGLYFHDGTTIKELLLL